MKIGVPIHRAQVVVTVLMALVPAFACAQDDMAARTAAAERYFEVVPVLPLIEGMAADFANLVPTRHRGEMVGKIKALIDKRTLAKAARDALVKTYTADEIRAMVEFYQSKHGASIVTKMPAYNAELSPALMAELHRALRRYDEAKLAGR